MSSSINPSRFALHDTTPDRPRLTYRRIVLLFADLPPLFWLGDEGAATIEAETLTMSSPAGVDWFNDPATGVVQASAAALTFLVDGDFQLSATVAVGFGSTFDAGVLFLHQNGDDWAKLCFEQAPNGDPTVVSVVTRKLSDDANGPTIDGTAVRLRISRIGRSFAFHYATLGADADAVAWHLVRLFALRDPDLPVEVGFLSQSPTGPGCVAQFSSVVLSATTLVDVRDGT